LFESNGLPMQASVKAPPVNIYRDRSASAGAVSLNSTVRGIGVEPQILDVAVAEVEAVVEPDRVPDDGGWETVPLIGVGGSIHAGMVAQARLI
jgi:hypothetical protein